MARSNNRFTARSLASKIKPGFHADGDGLYLKVTIQGTRSWAFRYQVNGRARWMGLGSVQVVTLQEARHKAQEARRSLFEGIDPIDARKALLQSSSNAITFEDAAVKYIEAHTAGWKSSKHAGQWTATLEAYAFPIFGARSVDAIDVGLVMQALEPIWTTKPETAKRVRGRIEAILDWAAARGYRKGDNPARWRGHLDKLLPAKSKVRAIKHHVALPYEKVGTFMATLRGVESVTARALEFTVLTACRTTEVREATWPEIDLAKAIWTIPAERMKGGREHRVPLTARAIELLSHQASTCGQTGLVFPGRKPKRPLSDMAMLMLVRRITQARITTHGFRSTFRDWCAERTNYPREVCELALAHANDDKVEAAYRRGDLMEKRSRLMAEWAAYCDRPIETGEVIPLMARFAHG